MRHQFLTTAVVAIVLVLLVALNLVFISEPRAQENEIDGDRSSYKGSPYGTLAFYLLLEEQGYEVTRFEDPYTDLAESEIGTLVVVSPKAQHQPTEEEFEALFDWVSEGGHLVILDREIIFPMEGIEITTTFPSSTMTTAAPVAPTALTQGVAELQLTTFVSAIEDEADDGLVHFSGEGGDVVIEKPYGDGRITFVSEPYVVQNNGISESDNLALALNLIDGIEVSGKVAFDEYHHGYGVVSAGLSGTGIRGYISGTPIPWMLLQLALIAFAAAVTFGTRFGRPIPLAEERRTSALEFVSSMANIQRLAKASDLALENIYGQFRASLRRYAGLSQGASSERLAAAAAKRAGVEPEGLQTLLRRCDAAMLGIPRPPSHQELVDLVAEIRRYEQSMRLT